MISAYHLGKQIENAIKTCLLKQVLYMYSLDIWLK